VGVEIKCNDPEGLCGEDEDLVGTEDGGYRPSVKLAGDETEFGVVLSG
jgi:hypothetical protein